MGVCHKECSVCERGGEGGGRTYAYHAHTHNPISAPSSSPTPTLYSRLPHTPSSTSLIHSSSLLHSSHSTTPSTHQYSFISLIHSLSALRIPFFFFFFFFLLLHIPPSSPSTILPSLFPPHSLHTHTLSTSFPSSSIHPLPTPSLPPFFFYLSTSPPSTHSPTSQAALPHAEGMQVLRGCGGSPTKGVWGVIPPIFDLRIPWLYEDMHRRREREKEKVDEQ